jgi:cyanophycin synthetase
MKIVERRMLRGPNLHALRPCLLVVVDLEGLDEVASSSLDGFTDRLVDLIPTLSEHRCSKGHPGGFVERLREGTYMAHIVEHVTLELQCLAGHEVGFGKARMVRDLARHYRIVVAYREEAVVDRAIDIAVDLVEHLAQRLPFDLPAALGVLRSLAARTALGPSTRAIVEAARARSIPALRLTDSDNLIQLGWGAAQQRIQAASTSKTSQIAVDIASDKALTKRLLAEAGLPVPQGRVVTTAQAAQDAAAALGGAVVVKPIDGNQGKGVSTHLDDPDEIARAFERAQAFGRKVIVEECVRGDDYRILVVGASMVAGARRSPPAVVGDGQSTIRELVERENLNPARGEGHENVLTRIRLDEACLQALAEQQYGLDSVPPADRRVRLRGNANLSTGGTAQDVTAQVHPETARACVRAARKIGLDVAGIDLVCSDIERPLGPQRGAIIEVNASPGLRMHEHPSHGERHPVGAAIVDSLYPRGSDGRIPVFAITGTNGKTTTTLAISHVMQRLGRVTGTTTTEGVFINGQAIAHGDCTGYWSARSVLMSPDVEVAVLETARGGLLKRGLGFDRCDVAVLLNIAADHLGQDGIDTLEDLAEVKGLIVEVARRAVVLNAQDDWSPAIAERRRHGVELIYFSLDHRHPVLAAHLRDDGRAVYEQDGMLMLAQGEHRVPLIETARLPFTLGGRARHNVANALAAFAALSAADVPREQIANALATFTSGANQNPLRLNIYRAEGVTLMIDYAHNLQAYEAIIDTGRRLTSRQLIGVVAVPGDRRESDIADIGRACGKGFDELVVYEMDDLRDRPPGWCAEVLLRGAEEGCAAAANGQRRRPVPRIVPDVREAIRAALNRAQPGDLVVVGCASDLSDLKAALGHRAEALAVHADALDGEDGDAAPPPTVSEPADA